MMSHYNQEEVSVAFPPPLVAYAAPPTEGYPSGSNVVAPPAPMGYPTKDGNVNPQHPTPAADTKSRGEGFWKGCFAALCCCCVLETCC